MPYNKKIYFIIIFDKNQYYINNFNKINYNKNYEIKISLRMLKNINLTEIKLVFISVKLKYLIILNEINKII